MFSFALKCCLDNTGATRTVEADEVIYARQKLITVAKAFKIQAIDIVHINYKGKLKC